MKELNGLVDDIYFIIQNIRYQWLLSYCVYSFIRYYNINICWNSLTYSLKGLGLLISMTCSIILLIPKRDLPYWQFNCNYCCYWIKSWSILTAKRAIKHLLNLFPKFALLSMLNCRNWTVFACFIFFNCLFFYCKSANL